MKVCNEISTDLLSLLSVKYYEFFWRILKLFIVAFSTVLHVIVSVSYTRQYAMEKHPVYPIIETMIGGDETGQYINPEFEHVTKRIDLILDYKHIKWKTGLQKQVWHFRLLKKRKPNIDLATEMLYAFPKKIFWSFSGIFFERKNIFYMRYIHLKGFALKIEWKFWIKCLLTISAKLIFNVVR